jgi:hypothetical protein
MRTHVMTDPRQFDRQIRELNLSLWLLARDMARTDVPYAKRMFGLTEIQARRLATLRPHDVEQLSDDPQPHWEIHHPRQISVLLSVAISDQTQPPIDATAFRAEIKELNISLWHLARDIGRTDPDLARRVFGLSKAHADQLGQLNLRQIQELADDVKPTWHIHNPKSLDLLMGQVISDAPEDRTKLVRLSMLSARIPALSIEDL